MHSAQCFLADEAATADLAQRFALQPQLARLRIDLYGDLGAGKTTWVRHLLRALGVQGRIKSPTYALLEPYELPQRDFSVLHFDLYRLASEDEWLASGLQEDAQGPGLRLIEWPQKAGAALGAPDLALELVFAAAGADADTDTNADAARNLPDEPLEEPPQTRLAKFRAYSSIGLEVLENVLKCTP